MDILRYARSFLAGTLLSRFTGFFRDMAIAISFGSSPEIAAFFVAYRLSNLFRRVLGEGNLQAGFIPHYSSEENGSAFYRDALFSLGLIALMIVALLEAALYTASFFVSPDWIQILHLTMWMAPSLIFLCLYGLNTAVLQCHKKFFLSAVSPIAFNLVWIIAAFLTTSVQTLSIAIVFAFMGQWLLTAIAAAPHLPKERKPRLFSQEFKSLMAPLSLGLIGVAAVQCNSALDAIFARLADLSGPAYLWYAIRLEQLPLALFGISLSSALLPALSRTEDPSLRKNLQKKALSQATTLMLTCTFGILALGGSSINLLYGRGDFTASDVVQTLNCLWGYGLGLTPAVLVLLLAPGFYAEKNYKRPAMASLASVILNVALNALFVFVFDWGALSIALATSLSAFLNMAILSRGEFDRSYWLHFAKMGIACIVPTILVFSLGQSYPREFTSQAMQFGIGASIYFGGLIIMAKLLKIDELFEFVRKRLTP